VYGKSLKESELGNVELLPFLIHKNYNNNQLAMFPRAPLPIELNSYGSIILNERINLLIAIKDFHEV